MLSERELQMLLLQAAAIECRSETSIEALNLRLSFFHQTGLRCRKPPQSSVGYR